MCLSTKQLQEVLTPLIPRCVPQAATDAVQGVIQRFDRVLVASLISLVLV